MQAGVQILLRPHPTFWGWPPGFWSTASSVAFTPWGVVRGPDSASLEATTLAFPGVNSPPVPREPLWGQAKPGLVALYEKICDKKTGGVWDCNSASADSLTQGSAATVPLEMYFGCARLWITAFLPPPPPPLSPPYALPLTHPVSCSRAAFLEVRDWHASCFTGAIWAFKGAYPFAKLLMIRCNSFTSPLPPFRTSPLPSPLSHAVFHSLLLCRGAQSGL